IDADIDDLNAGNQLQVKMNLSGLQLDRVAEYFETKLPVSGVLEALQLEMAGQIEKPHTWTGSAVVRAVSLRAGAVEVEKGEFEMQTREGRATMTATVDLHSANTVRFQS